MTKESIGSEKIVQSLGKHPVPGINPGSPACKQQKKSLKPFELITWPKKFIHENIFKYYCECLCKEYYVKFSQ